MQSMMVTLYKCLHGMVPPYLRAYLQERYESDYNLRGYNKLEIPHGKTTNYGFRSYIHFAPHVWNNLTIIPVSETLASFNRNVIDYIH